MAYLRGESYVDGNLIVEGALKVSKLQTTDGNLPALGTSYGKNHLVIFQDDKGTIGEAKIMTSSASEPEMSISEANYTSYLDFNYYSSCIRVRSRDITLNEKSMTWGY